MDTCPSLSMVGGALLLLDSLHNATDDVTNATVILSEE